MPFLPMKYPEHRLSMEAALPSSVHRWLRQELEQLGIDSLVYTRYIISLLLQDDEDWECLDSELDIISNRKGRKSSNRHKKLSVSEEERKKYAAIQCLSAVTDEQSGIETLVEELCSRLKDTEIQASVRPNVKSRSCSSDGSDDCCTENQNPAQKYYAAFPALSQGTSNPSPTVWCNKPLVNKSLASLTSEDDGSSSTNEDAEIRKINIPYPVAEPKQRKQRKNNSRNKREHRGNSKGRRDVSRSAKQDNQKGKQPQQKEQQWKPPEFPAWPPGFAKLDSIMLQNLGLLDDDTIFIADSPKRPNDELCTRVESLLKGMLLPAPQKTYKELQDVDIILPEELRDKIEKKSKLATYMDSNDTTPDKGSKEAAKTPEQLQFESDSPSLNLFDERVSPELKEQEIWYTQPIDVIFHSQDDEVSNSKLRLYKRNSYPSFSPEPEKQNNTTDCVQSLSSSPCFNRDRSLSFASDNSDDIFEGSILIPAWLTDVISADEHSDENCDDIDLSVSLKCSSPFCSSVKSEAPACLIGEEAKERYGSAWSVMEADFAGQCLTGGAYKQHDDNCTPTPHHEADLSVDRPCSVSLVDWDYMSRFVDDATSDLKPLAQEEGLTIVSPRHPSINTLWQSQVLFDYSMYMVDSWTDVFKPLMEIYDIHCWQPLGTSPYSQLWDVNMQKRPRMSTWEGSLLHGGDGGAWLAENTLVFMQLSGQSHVEEDVENQQSENTLIPTISFQVNSESEATCSPFLEHDNDDVDFIQACQIFDRSASMADVPSLWQDEAPIKPDSQLSKSFELVPSEHSAFYDVPRKLLHVHSEPNLVQFRQDCVDGSKDTAQSPQEHLYFSPKTHFRPITPAYAPDLQASKAKQQVCNDLFGGLPSTKTPYQQYHSTDYVSEDESFIPSFKVKNYSKSIQTGESFDNATVSPAVSDISSERATPEALTLSIIEDIMREKEEIDKLLMVDDLDAGNADSAYETDVGGNQAGDNDGEHSGVRGKGCVRNASLCKSNSYLDWDDEDHGNLGEAADFMVQSFMATFPHTQDWPDSGAHSQQQYTRSDNIWNDKKEDGYPLDGWCQFDPAVHGDDCPSTAPFPVTSQPILDEDLALDHLYGDSDIDKYKNIWSTAGQDYYSIDVGASADNAHFYYDYGGEVYDNVAEVYDNVASDDAVFNNMYDNDSQTQPVSASSMADNQHGSTDDKFSFDVNEEACCNDDVFMYADYAPFPDSEHEDVTEANTGGPDMQAGDFYSVKLVYKDKQDASSNLPSNQKSYGSYDLMPMPDEAVMSTELEREWLDVQSLWSGRIPSGSQKKPCSFYLEGNCRRSGCKFAHDISNITCRFWEEGGCFKGPLCPFLHGYPRESSPAVDGVVDTRNDDKDRFNLNTDEFPELSLSVKNGNTNIEKVCKKHKRPKSQNQVTGNKREKGRRGNTRRHSNKENRCEVKIIDKCCSSI